MRLLTVGNTYAVTLYFPCVSNLDPKHKRTEEDASANRALASPLTLMYAL